MHAARARSSVARSSAACVSSRAAARGACGCRHRGPQAAAQRVAIREQRGELRRAATNPGRARSSMCARRGCTPARARASRARGRWCRCQALQRAQAPAGRAARSIDAGGGRASAARPHRAAPAGQFQRERRQDPASTISGRVRAPPGETPARNPRPSRGSRRPGTPVRPCSAAMRCSDRGPRDAHASARRPMCRCAGSKTCFAPAHPGPESTLTALTRTPGIAQ